MPIPHVLIDEAGFSLLETLIALAITSLAMFFAISTQYFLLKQSYVVAFYAAAESYALDIAEITHSNSDINYILNDSHGIDCLNSACTDQNFLHYQLAKTTEQLQQSSGFVDISLEHKEQKHKLQLLLLRNKQTITWSVLF